MYLETHLEVKKYLLDEGLIFRVSLGMHGCFLANQGHTGANALDCESAYGPHFQNIRGKRLALFTVALNKHFNDGK